MPRDISTKPATKIEKKVAKWNWSSFIHFRNQEKESSLRNKTIRNRKTREKAASQNLKIEKVVKMLHVKDINLVKTFAYLWKNLTNIIYNFKNILESLIYFFITFIRSEQKESLFYRRICKNWEWEGTIIFKEQLKSSIFTILPL